MPTLRPKRGAIPTPKDVINSAAKYRLSAARETIQAQFLMKPNQISFWGNDQYGDCVTAEEAFAKACYASEIFVPDNIAIYWAQQHGYLNGAYLSSVMTSMQNDGFFFSPDSTLPCSYNDGSFSSVDWTDSSQLQSAILTGPVKIGVAADQLETAWNSTDGQSGWFGIGFSADSNEDHCVSLCGYGTIDWLAQQFGVNVPSNVDGQSQAYALFTWNSIGIIDVASMCNITQEAWVRQPTTVIDRSKSAFMVFHQGFGADSNLWCTGYDGTNWSNDVQVPNTNMSDSPSAVALNNQVYAFHQGNQNCGQLWYNTFNGTGWLGDEEVPNTGMSCSPSVVALNSQIYAFHQGSASCGELWFNVFDGTNWSGDTQVPNTGMSSSPSAVALNGQIYVFHQGFADCGELWFNVFDGTDWSGDAQVPNTGMSCSPSAVVLNGQIYVFHQGFADCGELWYNTFDGTNWSGDTQVPNTGMTDSPAASTNNGVITVFHQGSDACGQLWANSLGSGSWSGDVQAPWTGMSFGPGVVYTSS